MTNTIDGGTLLITLIVIITVYLLVTGINQGLGYITFLIVLGGTAIVSLAVYASYLGSIL